MQCVEQSTMFWKAQLGARDVNHWWGRNSYSPRAPAMTWPAFLRPCSSGLRSNQKISSKYCVPWVMVHDLTSFTTEIQPWPVQLESQPFLPWLDQHWEPTNIFLQLNVLRKLHLLLFSTYIQVCCSLHNFLRMLQVWGIQEMPQAALLNMLHVGLKLRASWRYCWEVFEEICNIVMPLWQAMQSQSQ